MRGLDQILNDLKNGESIDLYVTVLAALIVTGLNVLGALPATLLGPVTLAALGILAIGMLGNRHRLEQLRAQLDQSAEPYFRDYPEELESDIEKASEIWICGVSADGELKSYHALLEKKLRQGKTVRFVVVDADEPACAIAAARVPGTLSVSRERNRIKETLADLSELRKISPGKLSVRMVNDPLLYGAFVLDPDYPSGAISIRRYSYQTGTPRTVYRPSNHFWYQFYKQDLYSLWNNLAKDCPFPE